MATCPCECAAFRLEPSRLLRVACGMKSTLFPECGQWNWPLRNFHAGPLLWGQSDWKRAEGGLTDLIGARLHSKLSFYSQSLIWGGLGGAKAFVRPKSKLSPLHHCLWGFLFSALSSPVLSPALCAPAAQGCHAVSHHPVPTGKLLLILQHPAGVHSDPLSLSKGLWPWPSCQATFCFHFLFWKVRLIIAPTPQVIRKMKWNSCT